MDIEPYNPILVYHMDMCPRCKTRSLDIYDQWNNAMGYAKLLNNYERGLRIPEEILNKRPFYTFRCKRCGICSPIRWENGFPYPDFNPLNLDLFLAKYQLS